MSLKLKMLLKRLALWVLVPLVLAALIAILASTGMISLPLLAGFSMAAIGGIVFGFAAVSGVGLSGLLWLMLRSLRQVTKEKAYSYFSLALLLGLSLLSVPIIAYYLPIWSFGIFASLGSVGGALVLTLLALAVSAVLLIVLFKGVGFCFPTKDRSDIQKAETTNKDFQPDDPQDESEDSLIKKSPVDPTIRSSPIDLKKGSVQYETPSPSSSSDSGLPIAASSNLSVPLSPFTIKNKMDIRLEVGDPVLQWEADKAEVETFFLALSRKVNAHIMKFPTDEGAILALAIDQINICAQGLKARYSVDKITVKDKEAGKKVLDCILGFDFFKLSGPELHQLIKDYSKKNLLKKFATPADIEKQRCEFMRRAEEVLMHSKQLAKDFHQIGDTAKETRGIYQETRAIAQATIAEAQEVKQQVRATNQRLHVVIEDYKDLAKSQAETEEAFKQMREQLDLMHQQIVEEQKLAEQDKLNAEQLKNDLEKEIASRLKEQGDAIAFIQAHVQALQGRPSLISGETMNPHHSFQPQTPEEKDTSTNASQFTPGSDPQ